MCHRTDQRGTGPPIDVATKLMYLLHGDRLRLALGPLCHAARTVGHDFPGFGLHSLRRANITWRQEVGASSIEASKIAGHSSVNMTNDYTHVQLRRQEDLTRAIQERLQEAGQRIATALTASP